MKSNKICSELRKGANFAAANLPLRPQKTTMTDSGFSGRERKREKYKTERKRYRNRERKREKDLNKEGERKLDKK